MMKGPSVSEAVLIAAMAVLGVVTVTACCIKSINSPSPRAALIWGGVVLVAVGITLIACLVTSPIFGFTAK